MRLGNVVATLVVGEFDNGVLGLVTTQAKRTQGDVFRGAGRLAASGLGLGQGFDLGA